MPWGEDEGHRDSWGERSHPHYQKHERRSEESYHRRRPSPYHELGRFLDAGEGPRHRETFRENTGYYEDRRGEMHPGYKQNYVESEPGWRQDQTERGSRERFRDRSPLRHNRNNRQRGRGQYRRHLIHTDTWTPDNQQHVNKNRREMDGSPHSGCDWEEQRFSADERREGFYRNDHEPLRFRQNRNEPMEPQRREEYSPERDTHRPRRSRSMSREEMRGGHFEENRNDDGYRDERRSPFGGNEANFDQYKDRPSNRGGSRGNFNSRGRFYRRGRGWPRGNRPHPHRVQSPPNEPPKFREEGTFYDEPEAAWEQKSVDEAWDDDEDREMVNSPRNSLEKQQPREQWRLNETRPNMTVITEETLTIKVDMSRPVNKNSLMLYSADRPLSLDLVHVGRQRLDFLSSSEQPAPNQEGTVRIGTFAREIIALMHQVKDQYFGGQGIPLSERFSAQQSGKYDKEEPQEMTLNKRFSSNRPLNVNYDSLTDRDEPLFSKQGPLQLMGSPPLRDPDDLRHDLEKRRQERLEGVKVTIMGPQRPLKSGSLSPSEETFEDKAMEEEEEFSDWSEEPQRQEGPMGPRRGGSFRPFRRNNRPMRRPYNRNHFRGQNW